MRIVLLVPGVLMTLSGTVFALQGAYLLPATFMRGPDWILIGSAIAAAGLVLDFLALRRKRAPASESIPKQ